MPDLLLCDISLPGGDICEAVRELRHNQYGNNPFCSIILFIDEPNENIVRAASQAGLDDLQIKPVVAQKVLDRINYLVAKRKPFVVTTDYIGPDRRSSKRPGTQDIPTMDVPNSIALKAEGKFDPRKFQKDVESSFWNINAQKIERHAFQIGYLVNHIVPAYQAGQFNKESLGMAQRLVVVAEDIAKDWKKAILTTCPTWSQPYRKLPRHCGKAGHSRNARIWNSCPSFLRQSQQRFMRQTMGQTLPAKSFPLYKRTTNKHNHRIINLSTLAPLQDKYAP